MTRYWEWQKKRDQKGRRRKRAALRRKNPSSCYALLIACRSRIETWQVLLAAIGIAVAVASFAIIVATEADRGYVWIPMAGLLLYLCALFLGEFYKMHRVDQLFKRYWSR